MMSKKYPRDMIGYGANEPKVVWPNNAKLALQIVLNYEEGGENSPLHGDKYSETFLSEIIGAQAFKERHMNMESMYEYGSRRGFWRLQSPKTSSGSIFIHRLHVHMSFLKSLRTYYF